MNFLPKDKGKDFRLFTYILALPVGLALFFYTWLIRRTVKESYSPVPSGNRRFMIGFHREFPLFLCSKKFWDVTTYKKPAAYVGQHSLSGYATSLELYNTSFVDLSLSTDPKSNAYQKVLKFLNNFENDVYMRTDSGGPYDKVRKTAIRLAIESKRDLVCFRQRTDKYFLILKHFFALPFAKIKTRWTRVFSWQELEKMGIEKATQLVQMEMTAAIDS